MQFNTFVSSINDLERCVNAANLKEILLQPTLLARQGQLSKQQTHSLASTATKYGLNPVLVWDILMPEQTMKNICMAIRKQTDKFYKKENFGLMPLSTLLC